MGRLASYSKKSIVRVLKEHERSLTFYKNDVDQNRIHLNYTFGAGSKSAEDVLQLIENRCKAIMGDRRIQDQTNLMSDWVFTYPKSLCEKKKYDTGEVSKKTGEPIYKTYYSPKDPEHCKKWMTTIYEFCQQRYGAENVIAGYVHMDETTPHIDINLVPEAVSRKTGKQTVSSASLFTRTELRKCQQELEACMEKEFNHKGMILNGRTAGNYTIDELKARNKDMRYVVKHKRDLQAREDDLKTKQEEFTLEREKWLKTQNTQAEEYLKAKEDLDTRETSLKASEEALKAFESDLQAFREDLQQQVDNFTLEREKWLKTKNTALEDEKKQLREQYEMYCNTLQQKLSLEYRRSNGRPLPQGIKDMIEQSKEDFMNDFSVNL